MKNKITILGRCPSKKNGKIMVCRGKFPMLLPSAKHKEWHDDAVKQLVGVKAIPPNTPIIFTMFAPDARKGDLSNKFESVADVLVDVGIMKDDNWFIMDNVHMKFGGIDKLNPRIELDY